MVNFKSMRSRVAVALAAMSSILLLVAGYAGYLTFEDGLRLRDVERLHNRVYAPAADVITELQRERQLSVEIAAGSGSGQKRDLAAQRAETRRVVAAFTLSARDDAVAEADPRLSATVIDMVSRLSELDDDRTAIDAGTVTRAQAAAGFTAAIETALLVLDAIPANSASEVGHRHRALVTLQRARETIAQQVTLLAGALAAEGLTERDYREFAELNGTQQYVLDAVAMHLHPDQLTYYEEVLQNEGISRLQSLAAAVDPPPTPEDGESAEQRPMVPFSAREWTAAGTAAMTSLQGLDENFSRQMLASSNAQADTLLRRAWGITIGGALLILLLVLVWIVVAPKHVIGELTKLRRTAEAVADKQLPEVVGKLQRGEPVDVATAAAPVEFGPDEFGDVGRAINHVARTAVASAVEAAERRSWSEVLVGLARRTQGLVQQQIQDLDQLERRVEDPDMLSRLFEVDRAVTQHRRYAENLLVLAGVKPRRRWTKPVPVFDVIRAAGQEVKDYPRVDVTPMSTPAKLDGRVVADVTHMLAELIENAAKFSPPHTKVRVSGEIVGNGFVVEVEDRGLGMTQAELVHYNKWLEIPPEPTVLENTAQLGLFVVSQLAPRHDIRVRLRPSPYGGTTAIALIPTELIVAEEPAALTGVRAEGPQEVPTPAAEPSGTPSTIGQVVMLGPRTNERGGSKNPAGRPAPSPVEAARRDQPPVVPPSDGGSGLPPLPFRVRQASLAKELEEEPVPAASAVPGPVPRSPEEVRNRYSTYQRGTERGRADTAGSGGDDQEPIEPGPTPPPTAGT